MRLIAINMEDFNYRNINLTGIIYEPWHYRYVGVEDATKIMELGITLEEYLEEYY